MRALKNVIMIKLIKSGHQRLFNNQITCPVEEFNQRGKKIRKRSNFERLSGTVLAERHEPAMMSIIV